MKKFLLTAVSAAALAAAVSAMEILPAPGRALPPQKAPVTVVEGPLALEALENLVPGAGARSSQITFAIVSEADPLSPAGAYPAGDIAAWQVQILDSGGKKVSFIQGNGQPPPPALPWAGTAPDGAPLPGGFYSARLVWLDAAGRPHATRPVSFNVFSELALPKFADLKLDFRFAGGFPKL